MKFFLKLIIKVFSIVIILFSFLLFAENKDDLLRSIYYNKSVGSYIDKDIKNNWEFNSIVKSTINTIAQIAIALGVTFMIIGGIRFFTSAHDEGKFTTNRKNLLWIIVWLILVFSATSIILFIKGGVSSFVK